MKSLSRRVRTAAAVVATVAAGGSPAFAGGFTVARFGAEHGHPATSHPTAIYYNPAGLARGEGGTRVYLEGIMAYRTASYERPEGAVDHPLAAGEERTGTPADAVGANSGRAELSDVIASPFAGVVSDLGIENLGVGVGFYVPFGGSASWDKNEAYANDPTYPGAVDGVQRWQVIEGQQRSMYATAAGAYHIPAAKLTLGLGLNVVRNQVDTVRARTATGTDDLVTGSGAILEGRSLLEVSSTEIAVGAGAMWDPIRDLTVGLSWQSSPGFGETGLDGTLTNKFGSGGANPIDVELRQTLPDVWRLGFAYRVPGSTPAEIRLSGDWQRWSRFDSQCLIDDEPGANCALTDSGAVDAAAGGDGVVVNIPRDFRDTFGVRLGGSYWVTEPAEVFAGVSYDSNAVPDHTLDPTIIDMHKVIANGGVRYTLPSERFAVSASFTQVTYFERTAEPRPREMGEPVAPDAPSRNPDGAGTYDQSVSLVTIGVESRF